MSEVSFDTSGTVWLLADRAPGATFAYDKPVEWSDLDDFTQGYIEALFAGCHTRPAGGNSVAEEADYDGFAFSDLAPETVARIIADCAAFQTFPIGEDPFLRDAPRSDIAIQHWLKQRGTEAAAGAALWAYRSGNKDAFLKTSPRVISIVVLPKLEGAAKTFPPLTPYLADDGKVRFREASNV